MPLGISVKAQVWTYTLGCIVTLSRQQRGLRKFAPTVIPWGKNQDLQDADCLPILLPTRGFQSWRKTPAEGVVPGLYIPVEGRLPPKC